MAIKFWALSMPLVRFFLFAITFAVISGCVSAPQYSKADDPFKTVDKKIQGSFASERLCLLLTDNTNTSVKYLGEMRDMIPKLGNFHDPNEVDPQQRVAELTELLNSRFGETIRVRSLDEVATHKCNLTLALDMEIQVGSAAFQTNSVQVTGTFADVKSVKLDTLTAAGKSQVLFPVFRGLNFLTAWNQAMKSFGDSLDNSKAIANFVAGLPPYVELGTTIVAQSVAPANIDLAFWESIKNSPNPADFQAYLRKFPNGSFESIARSRLAALGEPVPAPAKQMGQLMNGKFDFGNYHALVIGINNYRSVTPLKTAAIDAKAVAEELKKDYGFKVTLLLDPTRSQILDSFDDLRRNLSENDNLLIYYAGHGHLDTDSDRGYWLPVDADANRRSNWLSNSDLTDMLKASRAKHVLVIADSCYSGTLTRSLSLQVSASDDYSRLAQKRARTALTSGGLEPVEDAGGGKHSVFAKAFLGALQSNSGIVDMSQLFSSMRREVILNSQQTPQYGDIRQTGHEGGDFIFARRKAGN